VAIVIIDGLVKEHTPGSLWEPATTYLFPSNWLTLPLAYGLLASPWGAHSIFPSVRSTLFQRASHAFANSASIDLSRYASSSQVGESCQDYVLLFCTYPKFLSRAPYTFALMIKS
jgi:hypothetical protein